MKNPKATGSYLMARIWTFNHFKQQYKDINLILKGNFQENASQEDTFNFYHRLDMSEKNRNLKI